MATWTVHPHTRGERTTAANGYDDISGSSPHPWGTLHLVTKHIGRGRFIPTPVGNASSPRTGGPWRTVHPHTHGERNGGLNLARSPAGSSPHPWGTRDVGNRRGAGERFIPTPVGNAPQKSAMKSLRTVHPHTRGERVSNWFYYLGQGRFIPTPVGNAFRIPLTPAQLAVHPHTRGERTIRSKTSSNATGSSPHPWGTRAESGLPPPLFRFIPTPVGNASLRFQMSALPSGSSPHPWGTQSGKWMRRSWWRFIPTPVGNASSLLVMRASRNGSSPHPWGTPSGTHARHD